MHSPQLQKFVEKPVINLVNEHTVDSKDDLKKQGKILPEAAVRGETDKLYEK